MIEIVTTQPQETASALPVQTEQVNPGGLAPAQRQCQYLLGDGRQCRAWALRGHEHCHRHHRYVHSLPERPIDVPQLEDPGSVLYVLSQTAQALAWGTLPTINGHAILAVCRQAHCILATQLETAKLRTRLHRLGIPEHEIFDAQPSADFFTPSRQANEEPGSATARRELRSEPSSSDPLLSQDQPEGRTSPEDPNLDAPTANPVKVRPKEFRFRDLKKNWDKELLRTQKLAGDTCIRRYGETQAEFEASHTTPFEHLAEIDREVEEAYAMGRALAEAQASAKELCTLTPNP